jgi:hypothetical protein
MEVQLKNKQNITDFPELQTVQKPKEKLPKIKVNGVATIISKEVENGISVKVNDKTIRLRYPPSIWYRFPKLHRKILMQNMAFGLTFQLPYLYTSIRKMLYNMPVPLSESFFFKGLAMALPSTAIMQSQKEQRITSNLLRRMYDIDYVFSSHKTEVPPYSRSSMSDRAIMPFTFGKDSLLTFALARELGIRVYPTYIAEPYLPYEEHVKKTLAESFKREFHTQINFLKNTFGVYREPAGWYGWELQLTQYSLMLLPYVYARKAGYILFSNEQSCDDMVVDEDGFRYNPVYEQSHGWLLQNSMMASVIGGNSLSIGSLLEPIHDLSIIKILHTRYPEIAKYQTSCDFPSRPRGDGRWCENCTKCGRMYIYLLAHGIDPHTVGFHHDLLRTKYHHLYTIFSNNRIKEFGFDQSEVGKNEQILGFLLAYKRGYRGPVMTSFIRRYLVYAKKNEKKFRQIYFGVHSRRTVPTDLRAKVIRIYHQELDALT